MWTAGELPPLLLQHAIHPAPALFTVSTPAASTLNAHRHFSAASAFDVLCRAGRLFELVARGRARKDRPYANVKSGSALRLPFWSTAASIFSRGVSTTSCLRPKRRLLATSITPPASASSANCLLTCAQTAVATLNHSSSYRMSLIADSSSARLCA